MKTSALKTFAPAVRRQLMEAVTRKLDFALSAKTPDFLTTCASQVSALRKLEQADRTGLIERVAYTWFTQSARLQAIEDFASLTEANRTQVLALTVEARAAIQSARFVTGIRDRLSRYLTQDYPAQLALLARLAAPPTKPGDQPGDKTPPVRYTPATSLRPQCALPFIATEADLEQWLAALRTAAQAELAKGNRISL